VNVDEGLEALREAIDGVDTELLCLLNRRMKLALEAGRLKQAKGLPLFQPGREEEIYDRLGEANTGPLPNESLRSVYKGILAASRLLQRIQQEAFRGDAGSRTIVPTSKTAPCGCLHGASGSAPPLRDAAEEPT
jgi:chorismate mutase / prephenate dehydratase